MQTFTGVVVSTKMDKSAVVLVSRQYRHPLYGKSVQTTKKYTVHIDSPVKEGDEISFIPCKPVSKTKKWKMIQNAKKSTVAQETKTDGKKKTKKKQQNKK